MKLRLFALLWLGVGLCWQLPTVSAQTPTPLPETLPAGLTIHVVQRDENLFRIALRYSTTPEYLAQLNGISNVTMIQVGQRLLVPAGDAAALPFATPTLAPTLAASDTNANLSAAPTFGIHTVAAGETLFSIAQQYRLTVNDLTAANNLVDATLIFAGQQLFIPGSAATEIPEVLPAPLTEITIKPLIFTEGETGSIRLITATSVTITGKFLGQELPIIAEANNTQHSLLVGIPIYTETGIYPAEFVITVADGTKTNYTLNIRVAGGAYTSQSLTISDELAPLLSQAPQDYELGLLQRLTSSFTPERYFTGAFGLPAAAPMNSPFGTRRSYNGGIYTGYHTGADFASAPGSPILAVAPGKVVLVDLLNIRGNTVVLDHGWGVFSAYSHQSQLSVQLEQMVMTGDIIGMAGATGRTTGPHLHWEVWVNGVPVNPLQWTREIFP